MVEWGCFQPYLTTVVASPGSVITPNMVISVEEKVKLFQEAPSLQEYLSTLDLSVWW